jgi:hypothetical protein
MASESVQSLGISARLHVGIAILAAILGCAESPNTRIQVPPPEPQEDSFSDHSVGRHPRKPIVVLVETNPWLQVLGADSPTFAFYSDGLTVFVDRSKDDNLTLYKFVVLNDQEREDFMASLAPLDLFWRLQDYYMISAATDQPTTTVHMWRANEHKAVSVYGDLRNPFHAGNAPQVFINVFARLAAYKQDRALPWLPEKVEVLLWPWDGAERPLDWPPGWPNLNDPSVKKGAETSSIFLSWEEEDFVVLKALVRESQEKRQPISVDGKSCAVSWRLPFPGEELWIERSSPGKKGPP